MVSIIAFEFEDQRVLRSLNPTGAKCKGELIRNTGYDRLTNNCNLGRYAELQDKSSSSILLLFFSAEIHDQSQARTPHTSPSGWD